MNWKRVLKAWAMSIAATLAFIGLIYVAAMILVAIALSNWSSNK